MSIIYKILNIKFSPSINQIIEPVSASFNHSKSSTACIAGSNEDDNEKYWRHLGAQCNYHLQQQALKV